MTWYQFKLLLSHTTTLSMDALHLLIGGLATIAIAALLRTSVANPRPWLAVLALEIANEANDLFVERWPSLAQQLGEGAWDIGLTMLLPTLLLLAARYRPPLFVACSKGEDKTINR